MPRRPSGAPAGTSKTDLPHADAFAVLVVVFQFDEELLLVVGQQQTAQRRDGVVDGAVLALVPSQSVEQKYKAISFYCRHFKHF